VSAIFQRRRLDTTVFLAVLALLGIGLILVASSTLGGRNADLTTRQALWMGIGLAAMLGMLAIDYRVLLKFSFPIYAASLVPLVYLLVFGHRIAHVRSWVRFGGYQFQPAELSKLATALLVAYLFENEQDRRLRPVALVKLFVMVLVPCLLVFLQPDLGLALTFLPLLLVGMYFGRMRARYWALLLVGLVVACAIGWFFLKDYQKQRITTFVHPDADVSGAGYQVRQSKIAVGSGGLVGKGYRRGTQSQLRFLPVRHTDFIFAVLAEEWGFLGVLASFPLCHRRAAGTPARLARARPRRRVPGARSDRLSLLLGALKHRDDDRPLPHDRHPSAAALVRRIVGRHDPGVDRADTLGRGEKVRQRLMRGDSPMSEEKTRA
jgi:rod shape determining protein RodA